MLGFGLPAPPHPRKSSKLGRLKTLIFDNMSTTMVMGDPAISDVYPDSPKYEIINAKTRPDMPPGLPSDCSDSESDWLNDTVVCHIDQRNINEQLNDEIEAMQAIVGEPDIGIDESFGDDFHDILQADEEPVSSPNIVHALNTEGNPTEDVTLSEYPKMSRHKSGSDAEGIRILLASSSEYQLKETQCEETKSLPSAKETGNADKCIGSHSDDALSRKNYGETDAPLVSPGTSLLPPFHPLACGRSDNPSTSPASLVKLASSIDVDSSPKKSFEEQLHSLRRESLSHVNREFADDRFQFASQLSSIHEKSATLDGLISEVSQYLASFYLMMENTYSQFASIVNEDRGSANRSCYPPVPPQDARVFTANSFWNHIQEASQREGLRWLRLLADSRFRCVVPLSLTMTEKQNTIDSLFYEAEILDLQLQEAENAILDNVQKRNQTLQKRKIACKKLSSVKHLNGSRTTRASISPESSTLTEFENEFMQTEVERLSSEEQFRALAIAWKSRLPALVSKSRSLNQERLTLLHEILESFVSLKHGLFAESLSDTLNAVHSKLDLQADFKVFSESSTDFGDSRNSNCDNSSANDSYSKKSRLGDIGLRNEEYDTTVIVKNYFLSQERPRRCAIDLWSSEGFKRACDFVQKSKDVATQLYISMEGIVVALETSSKQMRKAILINEKSSGKYFNSEPIQLSWAALLDAFSVEAKANSCTARFLRKAIVVLNVTRMEGNQLRSQFNRNRSRLERLRNGLEEESNRAQENYRIKIAEMNEAKRRVEQQLEGDVCPKHIDLEIIIGNYVSSHKAAIIAESHWNTVQRKQKFAELKEESALAVFLRFVEDCMRRHYSDMTKVLQGVRHHFEAQSTAARDCLQKMERMVQSIDTETDLRDFIQTVHASRSHRSSKTDSSEIAIDVSQFDAVHTKSLKGMNALRFLIGLFQEASASDDGFVRTLRKYPLDFNTSTSQSIRYSSLTMSLASFQKTIECIVSSIDERSSRMKEIAKSLRRQKSIIKTNIADIVNQHQLAVKRATAVENTYSNMSNAYKKAVQQFEKVSQKHEKDQERERSSSHLQDRRQSFIVTMIQGRLPNKSSRARLDSAIEVADRTQRALDHANTAWKEAAIVHAAASKAHLQSLQNINTTRINAVKWAFTTHCEHQTFYGQQLADCLSIFTASIDRIDAEIDLNSFIQSNCAGCQQPPDRIIISAVDEEKNVLNIGNEEFDWELESYCETVCDTARESVAQSVMGESTMVDTEFSIDSSFCESTFDD
uniref:Uncharacterized protein n=2 Tax=Spongospora subterranea TaxID=70186 RepID=A0A0H5QMY0_9EUKA|eukprot:CRZ02736.1 hypothetical protein [Spongospora subterranea]